MNGNNLMRLIRPVTNNRRFKMFKLVSALGKLVVSLYTREARRQLTISKAEAKRKARLTAEAFEAQQASFEAADRAAQLSAKSIKLKEIF
ncbi:hypothetical protein [Pectobacterium phage Jarilo]|uniref:Uncharacterized protein n=1 Tax=Pectobacterium phage Jarilo TaxID=2163634 RepID=A0A2S1GSX3_9CAUD|nr:hypothetical protein HOT17_gp19 [Pectobacterium phage Jarilo]AWD92500.1 hypothetical protein [Pectobacterium phage Jarilo]